MTTKRSIATALSVGLVACVPSARVHPRAAEEVVRGYRHLDEGDPERAEVAFEHALEFNRDFPEALNGLGIVARRHGDLASARRRFEQAIDVAPDFAEAHSNLGETWIALGELPRAEEELRAALEIDPDLVDARLNLARMLLHHGRAEAGSREDAWAAARREYLHLIESKPDLAEAHHDLAYMAYLRGDYAGAERGYRRAAEISSSAEALHGLCISLVRLGRCGEAAAQCRRCLEVAPGTAACQKSLGGALACSGAAGSY